MYNKVLGDIDAAESLNHVLSSKALGSHFFFLQSFWKLKPVEAVLRETMFYSSSNTIICFSAVGKFFW